MKTIIALTLLLLSSTSFSQTAVIFSKSHAGDLSLLMDEPDNFGEPPPPDYKKVILLENKCVVEIGTSYSGTKFNDTICDHWYFRDGDYSLDHAMSHYFGAKLIGFERKKEKNNTDTIFWTDENPMRNGAPWIFGFILISFAAYLFLPLLKNKYQS